MLVQTNMGLLPYEAIVAQINARYAEGKTPDLAVKSALQLGIDPAIIATLPGVDENAMQRGLGLISSGAFSETATGTSADIQTAAPVGSAQYNARKAAGLDAFGFPPEEVAQLTAAGLYGPGRQFDPGDMVQPSQNFSGLFSSGDALAAQAEEVLAASGKANDPRYADSIVGTFTKDGVIYNVQGDGSIQGIIESPTGSVLMAGFTPEGQQATEALDTRFEQTGLDRALGILANAAMAAGTGFALGPAGIGALSAPAAAAAGAGVTNFANTADLQQALKAAALAGGTAAGLGQLFPSGAAANSDAAFIAADAAQLASQGIGEAQINAILQASGVSPAIAANVASAAAEGLNPQQIINEVGNLTFKAATPTMSDVSTALNPNQVIVTGQGAGTGLLSDVSSLLGTVVPTMQAPTVPQVQITGQTFKPETTTVATPEVVSAAIPTVMGGTQQVNVTGQKPPKTGEDLSSTIGAIIPSIAPAIPTTTAPASEQVEVTAKKEKQPGIDTSGLSAAVPSLISALMQPLPKPIEVPVNKEGGLFNATDILKLLTLIGGTTAAGGIGGGTTAVGTLPTSDTRLGSTTPQFGDDYYAAVQRYYNAYMPETPRNVAGPLQQWYENKFNSGSQQSVPAPVVIPAAPVPTNPTPTVRMPAQTMQRPLSVTPQDTQQQQVNMFPQLFSEDLTSMLPMNVQPTTQTGIDLSRLSGAQRKYYDYISNMQGQGTPQEVFDYVRSLNDYQSLGSLAGMQGLSSKLDAGTDGFESMRRLSEYYNTPILNYGQKA